MFILGSLGLLTHISDPYFIRGIGSFGLSGAAYWWSFDVFVYWRRRRLAVLVSYGLLCISLGLLVAGIVLVSGH
jgi:hypothetical protein